MLSIKHIELSGHQTVREAKRVSSQPILEPHPERIKQCRTSDEHDAMPRDTDCGKREVFVEDENGDTHSIISGTIFVMNSAGQTIDRHYLGADGRGNVPPRMA